MAACPHCQLDVLASETVCPRCGQALADQAPVSTRRPFSMPGEEFDVARALRGESDRRASVPPPDVARRASLAVTAPAPAVDLDLLPLPALDQPVRSLDVPRQRAAEPPPARPAPDAIRPPASSAVDVPDLVLPGAVAAAKSVRAPAPVKGAPGATAPVAKGAPRSAAAASPAKKTAKTAKPAASAETLSVGAGSPDFDDDFGPSLSLEVDDAPRHRAGRSTRPPAAGGSGLGMSPPPRAPMGSVPPAGSRQASLPSVADTSDLDPYTVKRLAGFGAAPDALWETPFYALRVGWRLVELRRQTQAMRAAEVTSRHGLDEALVSFLDQRGEELRHEAATAYLFESLTDLQRRRDDWSHSLAEAEGHTATRVAEIDRELQVCERTVVDGRASRDGLAEEAARLFEATRASQAGAESMLAAVREQMNLADQEATAAIARRTELLRERRAVEEEHNHATRELRQGLAEADAPRRERLLEVGRTALDARILAGRPGSEALVAAEQKLLRATTERRLLEAAAGSYELMAVKRGVKLLAATVALTIVGVVLGVLRMNRELSAPPPVVPVVR